MNIIVNISSINCVSGVFDTNIPITPDIHMIRSTNGSMFLTKNFHLRPMLIDELLSDGMNLSRP